MEAIKAPDRLKLRGNLDFNWKSFKQRFNLFLEATQDVDKLSDSKKMALFLSIAGDEAIKLFNALDFSADEKDFETTIKKFEEYCSPKCNETYERYVFRARVQAEGETFEQFSRDLRIKAQTCNFSDLLESMIRDQIVYGIREKRVRERLLRIKDLTLEVTESECRAAEVAKRHIKIFDNVQMEGASDVINNINVVRSGDKTFKYNTKGRGEHKQKTQSSKNSAFNREQIFNCYKCGKSHVKFKCPAYKKQCNNCKGFNHFASVCKAWKKDLKVHTTCEDSEILYIGEEGCSEFKDRKDWWENAILCNQQVKFKIDTGSQANTVTKNIFDNLLKKPRLMYNKVILRDYKGHLIKNFGSFNADITVKGETKKATFMVVENAREPLLGFKSSVDLNLVQKVNEIKGLYIKNILEEYPELFRGLGCMKASYSIRLKENSVPTVHAARRVPHAVREKLEKELQRMMSLGVIMKIEEPTEWVNPITIIHKRNGSLRICLDPQRLNECIQREHYQIPTREEIQAELAEAKYFSKLDAFVGFYQIPLCSKSQKLCTFNTPHGRFCFRRLPFGIVSAPEIFHRAMNQIIEGLAGVKSYIDDILVWGSCREQHDERLRNVLKRLEEAGVTLNRDKCEIGLQKLTFLGEELTWEGMHPDPEKVKAVLNMSKPNNKEDIQRALGLVNYMGKFIPNLSNKSVALRELTKKDRPWEWGPRQEEEWQTLKTTLTCLPVLQFYNPKLELKISTDASKAGIGAVLLQLENGAWLPVAYASRVLSSAERKYAQIEKEALGLVYGCIKFHDYIYGRSVILETDHKPLISIIKKNIADASPRIQRILIKLLRYSFKLVFTPGKQLITANSLSRAGVEENSEGSIEEDIESFSIDTIHNSNISDSKLQWIRTETGKDPEMQELSYQIEHDWDDKYKAGAYKSHKQELVIIDGVILKGSRIVIPKEIRSEILSRIHEGHLGISKCKGRAREVVYWPRMNTDIEKMVASCSTCQKFQYKQAKEPFIMRPETNIPWRRVGSDLFVFGGKSYVVVMDAHSNYLEVEQLYDTSSVSVVNRLKDIFARHGIPNELTTDNGPQYSAQEFKQFTKDYDIVHITSSPCFAQSNGLAEKGVQIIKRIMKKAQDSGENWRTGLLNYRSTPLEDGRSPAELLMNRKIRTRLPVWDIQRQQVKKHKQNQGGNKPLRKLREGETVRLWNGKMWGEKAQVVSEVAPRSYNVWTEQDVLRRRNRSHLRVSGEAFSRDKAMEHEEIRSECLMKEPVGPTNVQDHASPETVNEIPLRRSMRVKKPVQRMNL